MVRLKLQFVTEDLNGTRKGVSELDKLLKEPIKLQNQIALREELQSDQNFSTTPLKNTKELNKQLSEVQKRIRELSANIQIFTGPPVAPILVLPLIDNSGGTDPPQMEIAKLNKQTKDDQIDAGVPSAAITGVSVTNVRVKLISLKALIDAQLQLSGGTLTDRLNLNADPANPLEAATEQYVDNLFAGLKWKSLHGELHFKHNDG